MSGILKFLEITFILGLIMTALRYAFCQIVGLFNQETFAYLFSDGGNFAKDSMLTILAASVISAYSYYVSNRGQ